MLEKLDVLKNVVNCVDENGVTRVVSGPECICAINDVIDYINSLAETDDRAECICQINALKKALKDAESKIKSIWEAVELLKELSYNLHNVSAIGEAAVFFGKISDTVQKALEIIKNAMAGTLSEEVKNTPIEENDILSLRATHVLKDIGINTVGDLPMLSITKLKRAPNSGIKVINEVKKLALSYGIVMPI